MDDPCGGSFFMEEEKEERKKYNRIDENIFREIDVNSDGTLSKSDRAWQGWLWISYHCLSKRHSPPLSALSARTPSIL